MKKLWDISKWQPIKCLVSGRVWDGARFQGEISRRVGFIQELGWKKGDVVFLYHSNSLEFLADLFALWARGVTATALSPALTRAELENLIGFSKPKAVLIGDIKTQATPFDVPVFNLSSLKGQRADFGLKSQDFGLVLFTSGTTDKPKGVVHSRRTIENKVGINLDHFGTKVFKNSLCLLSTHFVAGLFSSILTPLAAGGRVFLFPDPGVSGAAKIGKFIDENRITFTNSVPSLWNLILKSSRPPEGDSLKFISVASAPLGRELQKDIKKWAGIEEVRSIFGTTETGGWSSEIKGPAIGSRLAVQTPEGQISLQGTGELLIKTPSMMEGYFRRPDVTEKAFLKGWFKTGDLAEITEAGGLKIRGRVTTQINRAGIKIIPEEIEALLERHPEIRAACVFSYPDPVMGEGVAALLEPQSGKGLNFSELRNWCGLRVRSISVPEKWFQTETIPRNARGKVDRRAVEEKWLKRTK